MYLTQNRNRRVLVNTAMKFAIARNVGISRVKSKYFNPILTKLMLIFLNILGVQCRICAKYVKIVVP
jgi:hypothetical protein